MVLFLDRESAHRGAMVPMCKGNLLQEQTYTVGQSMLSLANLRYSTSLVAIRQDVDLVTTREHEYFVELRFNCCGFGTKQCSAGMSFKTAKHFP